jgi:protein subunit release factor A
MELKPTDLLIHSFVTGIPTVNGHAEVRITHVPTGISVSGTGKSQLRVRTLLMETLHALIQLEAVRAEHE